MGYTMHIESLLKALSKHPAFAKSCKDCLFIVDYFKDIKDDSKLNILHRHCSWY